MPAGKEENQAIQMGTRNEDEMETMRKIAAAIGKLAGFIFRVGSLLVACALLYKSHIANNAHTSIAEDSIQTWLAIGIAYLLIRGKE